MIAPTPAAAAVPPEGYALLREAFGFDDFRAGQAEVVAAVLARRDVLCVMPTGAGKSLCYQLPALMRDGVTLVVSPLISLMRDQVDALCRRGVAAAEINSAIPLEDQDQTLDRAARGELKLLFVAPERFRNERFRRRIAAVGVSLLAVDEAHCISQWGHDFRPDYRRLGAAIESLGRPQVLALTATAPPEVQQDVIEQLGLRDPGRFIHGIVRANLAYDVLRTRSRDQKDRHLLALAREPGATLVYCATRKGVNRLYDVFRAAGLEVLRYHAGLADEVRAESQQAFLVDGAPLMVATNAFGMGVDRADIRRVVHYEIPRSAEAYVQETGRAGRDGLPARCILFFHPGDLHVQRFFLESSNPSREVVTEVFHVLRAAGEGRLEMTAEEIAARMRSHVQTTSRAVSSALAILDRAAVVRRAQRGENLARVTVVPVPGDLFAVQPLPPGLGRLLSHLVQRLGVDRAQALDVAAVSAERGVTPETVRRGLARLHDLGRIDYVPAFRGRATELGTGGLPEDALERVDFDLLDRRRRHEEGKLEEMVAYVSSPGCRVCYLLHCFGLTDASRCGVCDRCLSRGSDAQRETATLPSEYVRETLSTVLEAVKAHDRRYGFRKLAGHLAGSNAEGVGRGPLARGATRGRLGHLGVKGAERWLRIAHDAGLLRLVPRKLAGNGRTVHIVALSPLGLRVLKGAPLPAVHVD